MDKTTKPPKIMNPLWIISVFFSFTEVTLGYAAWKTDGLVQGALIAFVLLFPTIIAIGFFIIVWYRPQHLYAPRDYSSDESFLEGLRTARESANDLSNLDKEIGSKIKEFLTSPQLFEDLKKNELSNGLKKAAEKLSEEIRDTAFFTVHLSPFVKNANSPKTYPVSLFRAFDGLTDAVYFAMHGAVPAFTYGKEWILRDKNTGRILKHARMISNAGFGKRVHDKRTLEEMDIKPGTELEVIAPPCEGDS